MAEQGDSLQRFWQRFDPALVRLVVFLGGLALAMFLVIRFDEIFFPLISGLTIAYLFDPAVSWFEHRGRSRTVGVVAILAIVVLLSTGFLLYVVPAIGAQFQKLGERLPDYQARLEHQLTPLLERVNAQYPAELTQLKIKARAALEENLPDLATKLGTWLGQLFGNVLHVVLVLLNLIFVPVFAFYLLVDFPKIKAAARDLIPVPYRTMVLDRLAEVDRAIAGFVRGQLTIAMVLAAINATGLLILGVPMGLAIGILAGLANLIPYMALVVGLVPALLLSWVEHQSVARVVGVVVVFSLAQLLEGMVLSPRILGKSVDLHPVWVLLAVIAGGSLFGLIGMLISVPVAAAIQVFVRHWLHIYKGSRVYRGDPTPTEPGG
jgi:predicted PurR-regulated permease PerM